VTCLPSVADLGVVPNFLGDALELLLVSGSDDVLQLPAVVLVDLTRLGVT